MLKFVSTLLVAVGLALPLSACAESVEHAEFAAGTHYRILEQPVPTNDPTKVEVREFFFYGCPHCYDVDPLVTTWKKGLPDDVEFIATPVVFLANSEPLARAFYVAEARGILDEIHRPIFDAWHKHREPLVSVPALSNFFSKFGVEPDEFNALYASFGVSTKVRQADALARDYQIRGVPAFAVNGKYVVLRQNLKNEGETFRVLDFLVEKERKAMGK